MLHNLQPYPALKDSGVPWLGEVPEHWEILPALAVYKPKLVKNSGMAEKTVLSLSYGRIIVKAQEKLHGLVPESFETYQIVDPGNIIVRTTDLQNDHTSLRIGYSTTRGIITSAYMCLETKERVSSEFGYQFLNAYDLLKIIYGFGSGLRQNLDFSHIKRMPVLVPHLGEQRAIVRFLEHADRRIKRFIAAKRRLIELLNEQKQAIIQKAVTLGLDPTVRLKASGIDWLGDVPEHWAVIALRIRYSVQLGKMLDSKRITGEFSIPYLRNTDVGWNRINIKDLPSMDIQPSEYDRFTVQPGDLLVCEGGEVGKAAFWNGDLAVCGFQKALHRVRPYSPEQDCPRFLYYSIYTAAKAGVFLADGNESTIAHLTNEKLRRHRFAFPPYDEQRRISDFLDGETLRLDNTSRRVEQEIDLIREYRMRLIADVVTGKLDVRGVELPPLKEAEELAPVGDVIADDATREGGELEPVEESADAAD